jgi:hypothetical protein
MRFSSNNLAKQALVLTEGIQLISKCECFGIGSGARDDYRR